MTILIIIIAILVAIIIALLYTLFKTRKSDWIEEPQHKKFENYKKQQTTYTNNSNPKKPNINIPKLENMVSNKSRKNRDWQENQKRESEAMKTSNPKQQEKKVEQSEPTRKTSPIFYVLNHKSKNSQAATGDDVALSLSTPQQIAPGQKFIIRFSAYLEKKENEARQLLQDLSPVDRHIMGAEHCKWQRDTKVTVVLYADSLIVDPKVQEFKWEGKQKILNFDIVAEKSIPLNSYITVKADVMITDIVIARLRVDLKVSLETSSLSKEIRTIPYRSAFASYASADNDLVKGRLSEIERNGVAIFWDRISLYTGQRWEPQLIEAIKTNEAFILFWSRNAKNSNWVTREWKTALEFKGLDAIDPHPLEDISEAPPPEELSQLHFDDKYLHFKKREW